jgi:hypothetical protein
VLLSVVSSSLVLAQEVAPTPPPAPPPVEAQPVAAPPPPAPVPAPIAVTPAPAPVAPVPVMAAPEQPLGDSTSVFAALNVGLFGVDVHRGHFYGFLSGNVGVPILTNGSFGAFALGAGYAMKLTESEGSGWFMDFFGEVNPGWQQTYDYTTFSNYTNQPFCGVGVGLGFRYLHKSGLTLGFKIPIVGFAINGGSSGAASAGTYYLANLVALPIVSIGIRF